MEMNNIHRINKKSIDTKMIDKIVKSNTKEIWEFDNHDGVFDHPIHMYGLNFNY